MRVPERICNQVSVPCGLETRVLSYVADKSGCIERIGVGVHPSTCNYGVFWTLRINNAAVDGYTMRPTAHSTTDKPDRVRLALPPNACVELFALNQLSGNSAVYVEAVMDVAKKKPLSYVPTGGHLSRDEHRVIIFHRLNKKDLRFETKKTKKPAACAELFWQLVVRKGKADANDLQANNSRDFVYRSMERLKEFLGKEYDEWLPPPTKTGRIMLKKPITIIKERGHSGTK
jgi:hypothetical protein